MSIPRGGAGQRANVCGTREIIPDGPPSLDQSRTRSRAATASARATTSRAARIARRSTGSTRGFGSSPISTTPLAAPSARRRSHSRSTATRDRCLGGVGGKEGVHTAYRGLRVDRDARGAQLVRAGGLDEAAVSRERTEDPRQLRCPCRDGDHRHGVVVNVMQTVPQPEIAVHPRRVERDRLVPVDRVEDRRKRLQPSRGVDLGDQPHGARASARAVARTCGAGRRRRARPVAARYRRGRPRRASGAPPPSMSAASSPLLVEETRTNAGRPAAPSASITSATSDRVPVRSPSVGWRGEVDHYGVRGGVSRVDQRAGIGGSDQQQTAQCEHSAVLSCA